MRRALLLLWVFALGCSVPWEPARPGDSACAKCHGDPTRPGDPLVQAAPPNNIYGNDNPATPGVGAHLQHLIAGDTHGPVACAECHLVPERTNSPGHDDTEGPAEVMFGALASQDERTPSYDVAARSCGNTYCHGPSSGVWNKPLSSAAACGSCHGLPPPPPHPQSQACEQCHGTVAGAGRTFVAPELHVNGKVELGQLACNTCHGSAASPAPPTSLDGGTTRDVPGVGAHTAHLSGGGSSRPVKCEECHRVPGKVDDPGHLNGGPAELVFSGVALGPKDAGASYAQATQACTTWCHSAGQPDAGSPTWTAPQGISCGGCHGAPPPPPHPGSAQCHLCHPNAQAPAGLTFANALLHVNGAVEVQVPQSCDACHGSAASPAPPRDTKGNTATTAPGVGAHQAHLVGTGFSRRPLCGECHAVPAMTVSPGHPDGVTQLVFSGVAVAGGSVPTYSQGTCANSWCHDTRPLTGAASNGGQFQAPSWTRLDGQQIQCNSCHGYPPAAPHPQQSNCGSCHSTMDGGSIAIPARHIDGKLDF